MRTIVAALVGTLCFIATSVGTIEAQAGCTSTKAIYCNGQFICTTDKGSSCVTCPS